MVSGARSPKEAAERQQADKEKSGLLDKAFDAITAAKNADAVARARPVGVREFGSLYRNFMLTVKRSDEREVNGITIPAKLQTICFQDGVLRTSDSKVIEVIESHRAWGRDIWDADALKVKAERAAAENFLSRVDDLPVDIKEQLRVKLGLDDFALPPADPEAIVDRDAPTA